MKRCPKCSRTFPDENQKFCTIDGGLLRADQPAFDPNLTVRATSQELTPPVGPTDFSEAPTSMQLPAMDETIASFGTTVRKSTTGPIGTPTSDDLAPPAAATPTSAELRPPAQAVSTSANLPPARTASAPLVQPVAPPKKKSVWPWVLVGGLLLLLLLGGGAAVAGYFLWLKPRLEHRRPVVVERNSTNENANTSASPANTSNPDNANTNANANDAAKKEPEAFTPTAGVVQFANSKANLDGKLLEHYVDFSFYYPKSWRKDPRAGVAGASNFARLSNSSEEYAGENVAVSWYTSNGTYELDNAIFHDRAKALSDQFAKSLPNYEEVSRGEATVDGLKAYEFRFKGVFKGTSKGDLTYWGRAILLPPGDESQKNGITILMLVTSLASGVSGPEDVGVKGELPLILESFRFGASR